jgi:hypothetical protein
MAEVEIVQPVEGATRVMFDYAAASGAIDAYSAMARRLGDQATGRVGPRDAVVVHWAGRYRDEFDGAWEFLQLRFGAGIEAAGYGPVAIYGAIADANEMQRAFNRNAEAARDRPPEPAWPEGVQ